MSISFQRTLGIAALLVAGTLQAQTTDQPAVRSPSDAGDSIQDILEGSRLTVGLEAGGLFTDNFYYTAETKDSGFGAIVKPGISWVLGLPRFRISAQGSGELGYFNQSSEDNYRDVAARLAADWQSAARHRFGYAFSFNGDHDPYGTERTEQPTATHGRNVDQPLDKWRQDHFDGTYTYGTAGSTFGAYLRLSSEKKTYTTNRQVTSSNPTSTAFLDYHDVQAQGTLFYNYSPKTALLFDTIGTRSRVEMVKPGSPDRGANEMRYRAGAHWLATAKTTGDVRVGYVKRSHVDMTIPDFTGLDWQATVGYSPQTWQLFSLQTGRTSRESYQLDVSFFDTRYYTLDWAQEWSMNLRSKASVGYLTTDFVGTARKDNTWTASINGEYLVMRDLTALGSVSYGQRDSNAIGLDYDRLAAYMGLRYVH